MKKKRDRYYVVKEDGGGGWVASWQIADRVKRDGEDWIIATVWESRARAKAIAWFLNVMEKKRERKR